MIFHTFQTRKICLWEYSLIRNNSLGFTFMISHNRYLTPPDKLSVQYLMIQSKFKPYPFLWPPPSPSLNVAIQSILLKNETWSISLKRLIMAAITGTTSWSSSLSLTPSSNPTSPHKVQLLSLSLSYILTRFCFQLTKMMVVFRNDLLVVLYVHWKTKLGFLILTGA